MKYGIHSCPPVAFTSIFKNLFNPERTDGNQNFCKKNKLFYHWLADRFYAYYVRLFKRYFVFFGTVVRTSLPAFYFN